MLVLKLKKASSRWGMAACLSSLVLAACGGGSSGGGVTIQYGAGSVQWAQPATREDGTTPLLANEIASYRVLYGPEPGLYNEAVIVDANNLIAGIADLAVGTYYAVVTAIDTEGRESAFSGEASVIVQ